MIKHFLLYYLIPAIIVGGLMIWQEWRHYKKDKGSYAVMNSQDGYFSFINAGACIIVTLIFFCLFTAIERTLF